VPGRRIAELIAALALLGGCVAAVLTLPADHVGRVVAGIGLVLVAGAAISAALLPGRIGGPERSAVVLGSALAATIAVSLAVDVSPWSLQATHWAIVLGGVGAIAAAIASVSRRPPALEPRTRWTPRIRDALAIAVAAVLVAGAMVVGFTPARAPAGTPGHTALWLAPSGQDPRRVEVGLTGGDLRPTAYRVAVALDGRALGAARHWTVGPAQTRSETVTAPPGARGRLTATLYRAGDPSPQRSVFLTLPGT
jgi:hypothetical protein